MNPTGPSCQELRQCLTVWLDGDLPPGDCARLRGHLEHCAHCQALMEAEPLTVELLRHCPPLPLSPPQARRLRQRVLQELGPPSPSTSPDR